MNSEFLSWPPTIQGGNIWSTWQHLGSTMNWENTIHKVILSLSLALNRICSVQGIEGKVTWNGGSRWKRIRGRKLKTNIISRWPFMGGPKITYQEKRYQKYHKKCLSSISSTKRIFILSRKIKKLQRELVEAGGDQLYAHPFPKNPRLKLTTATKSDNNKSAQFGKVYTTPSI